MRVGSVRVLLVIGFGAVLGLIGAASAQAHNVLRSTDPADGSTVSVAPATVVLTFDKPALGLGTEIEVRDPHGHLVSDGAPVLVDNTVSEKLTGELPAGAYSVAWRVTSADGHPIAGGFSFTATGATTIGAPAAPAASTATAAPASSSSAPGGSSAVAVLGVAVLVVAVIAVGLPWLLRRRRGVGGPADE